MNTTSIGRGSKWMRSYIHTALPWNVPFSSCQRWYEFSGRKHTATATASAMARMARTFRKGCRRAMAVRS